MADPFSTNPSPDGPQARHEAIAQKITEALEALDTSSRRLGIWAQDELDPLLEAVARFTAREEDVLKQTQQKLLEELNQLRSELNADEGALSGFAERVEELITHARRAMSSEQSPIDPS